MKRLHLLTILMIVAIIAIAGFQLYWLHDTYHREQKTLEIRMDALFKETVIQVQALKFPIGRKTADSGKISQAKISSNRFNFNLPYFLYETSNRTRNILMQTEVKDSLRAITKNQSKVTHFQFSTTQNIKEPINSSAATMIQMLVEVDSLLNFIVDDITKAYSKTLQRERINLSFKIEKISSQISPLQDTSVKHQITIGFIKPVIYKLQVGSTTIFLLKKITVPVLFSFSLLAITIASFILLYRTLRQQQKLTEIKNGFISNITHELKTPIATIGVAIEALQNFNAIDNPQRTQEYLNISQNELQRLSLLVDKVLKLSMFEKKEIELKYELVDLAEIVKEVATSMRLQFEKNHAQIKINKAGNLHIQGDKLHLLSMVFNLLDNALRYKKNNLLIEIEMKEKEQNILLSISDNGIGIPLQYQTKIFEKFFRVPSGDTHNIKGYGLGLSYVAHVVNKHQGAISVESQLNAGARFTVILPKQNV